MYYNNGNLYVGDWKNNKVEGKGIYIYNNGDIYEGEYINGKREGKGIYYQLKPYYKYLDRYFFFEI